jgi:hypothetical protein
MHRRWGRLAKVQAEAHTKLLDRFTANDELIAYVQSPAGSQFLQSAPIALDPGARRMGAPFNRILWSVQAGLVLGMAGLGLRFISGSKDPACIIGGCLIASFASVVAGVTAAHLLSRSSRFQVAAQDSRDEGGRDR